MLECLERLKWLEKGRSGAFWGVICAFVQSSWVVSRAEKGDKHCFRIAVVNMAMKKMPSPFSG